MSKKTEHMLLIMMVLRPCWSRRLGGTKGDTGCWENFLPGFSRCRQCLENMALINRKSNREEAAELIENIAEAIHAVESW